MKKIMFNVVSVATALLVLVVMSSCGGGGGGGGSGASSGEQGEPSGNSNYRSSQAFPYGFFRTPYSGGYITGALWILDTNSNSALYFADATHARTVTRVGSGNGWERTPSDGIYEVEIINGANGYIRFTAAEAWPAKYAYDISDDVLVISNTHHGTRRYHRCPNTQGFEWYIQ